jgi:hypothetical protein
MESLHSPSYDSDEIILDNLQYISDRWNCQFRLRWVLDLLELKKEHR